MNTIINKLKNSYAKEFELTEEEINSLSREKAVKILDWIISSVKLECSKEKAAEIFERVGYDLDVEYYDDDSITLYTYPDNNEFFYKKFEVEKSWLIDALIDIDKLNAREGVELSNFLQNYEYGETQLVYQKAKKESKLKSEVELKITKDIIRQGLSSGYIKLINCPQSTAETVCQINYNWFYFGGQTAEGVLPEEYKKIVPFEDIVNEIYNTLEAFRQSDWDEFHDEYACYEEFLRSINGIEMFVVDTLQNTFYKRIPNTLEFEINKKIKVKILENGIITIDDNAVTKTEFLEFGKLLPQKTSLNSTTTLYTYPDNNDFFYKRFEVEKEWLVDYLDSRNTTLSDLLHCPEFVKTQEIYKKAKEENKLVSEADLKITKDIIRHGLSSGYIKLSYENCCTVFYIYEGYYTFVNENSKGKTPEEYRKAVPFEDMVNDIYRVVESFRKSPHYEDKFAYMLDLKYCFAMFQSIIFVTGVLEEANYKYIISNEGRIDVFSPDGKKMNIKILFDENNSTRIEINGEEKLNRNDFLKKVKSLTE